MKVDYAIIMNREQRFIPKLRGLSDDKAIQLVPEHTILLGYRGSIAHGMYRNPEYHIDGIDDKDILGVCIAPINVYMGLDRFEVHEKMLDEWDSVIYELKKMIGLLAKGNPNVLSLLWLEDQSYIFRHPLGNRLIESRDIFVSRQIYHSFTGYAYSQLKRMTHFGDNSFSTGYMGAKRKALVEKFGYDCKNAAHLIRLLRMGIEFLLERRLIVQRPDAPQLMEIKLGHWTLEQVKNEADRLFKRAESAYDSCQLPNSPDRNALNNLSVGILTDWFREKGW